MFLKRNIFFISQFQVISSGQCFGKLKNFKNHTDSKKLYFSYTHRSRYRLISIPNLTSYVQKKFESMHHTELNRNRRLSKLTVRPCI